MPDIGRVQDRGGRKVDRRRDGADHAVAEVAARQQGLITLAQLIAVGLTRRMIRARVRRGFLHAVYRGVYAVGHPPITREARWLAAVLACGDDAVLSHRSAAALWGIRETSRTTVDVSATGRTGYTLSGIALHRATTLVAADRTIRNDIPVTSLPRTIIDLAAIVSPSATEYAIHRAEAQRKVTPVQLRAAVDRLPGVRGTATVRAIVGRPGHDLDARSRSPFERRFLAICRTHRISLPRVNEWIPLDIAAGGLEADFCWPEQRLIVEVDEDASHHTIRARRNDPERDRALSAVGWRTLRVAEREFAAPERIAERVLNALGDKNRSS